MVSCFKNLVSQERPSFVIDFNTVSGEELSCVYVKYKAGSKYYMAVSFYTAVWISKTPVITQTDTPIKSLADIANIICFNSRVECDKHSVPTQTYLAEVESAVRVEFVRQFKDVLPSHSDYDFDYILSLSPVPTLTARVKVEDEIVGSFIMESTGEVKCIQSFSQNYTDFMRGRKEQLHPMQLIGLDGK